MCCAAIRSRWAPPPDLNRVSSSSLRRPGWRPVARSNRSASTSAAVRTPRSNGWREIAAVADREPAAVDEQVVPPHGLVVGLTHRRREAADQVEMCAGPQPLAEHDRVRCCGRGNTRCQRTAPWTLEIRHRPPPRPAQANRQRAPSTCRPCDSRGARAGQFGPDAEVGANEVRREPTGTHHQERRRVPNGPGSRRRGSSRRRSSSTSSPSRRGGRPACRRRHRSARRAPARRDVRPGARGWQGTRS